MKRSAMLAGVFAALCATAYAQQFVPFVIPAITSTTSPLVFRQESIATTSPRVIAIDGHFRRDGRRMRFWGVNTSNGANLPARQDAGPLAERLAAAGVNSVRIHHLDTSPWPKGVFNSRDGRALEPEALDRLDYFVSQLAGHGIYVDLNLHVGRAASKYLGLPDPGTKYDKLVDLFMPSLMQAQQDYARAMLTRQNPYRGLRYADDPAVAIVEISNEDSFFMSEAMQRLRNLPMPYSGELRTRYNDWLKRRYGTTAKLLKAWSAGVEPISRDLLKNSFFTMTGNTNALLHWDMDEAGLARGTVHIGDYRGRHSVKLNVMNVDDAPADLSLRQRGLSLEDECEYHVELVGAADTTRTVMVTASVNEPPYRNLGLLRSVRLTPDWTTFTLDFICKDMTDDARICVELSGTTGDVYLAAVTLNHGGQVALQRDESLESGTVELFGKQEAPDRAMDRLRFLATTEKLYYDSMRQFIYDTLNCKALVTGTIVFGPLGLWAQSDMDFIDAHAYWKHPSFPGKSWDMSNWVVEQTAMTDRPQRATLWGLAAQRLDGKPYTVTEYNHAAPNDFQAECVPIIASYAAAQDWDGVWLFDYGADPQTTNPQRFSGFFTIEQNPAKWGFMRAGAAMFRDCGIKPQDTGDIYPLVRSADTLSDLSQLQFNIGSNVYSVLTSENQLPWVKALEHRVSIAIKPRPPTVALAGRKTLHWESGPATGLFQAEGPGARAFTGHARDFATSTTGVLSVSAPEFAAVTETAIDEKPLIASDTILVTACGRCENTGMEFSADRQMVNSWGPAPVQIEAVEGRLQLPEGKWKCAALGADGLPKTKVPIISEAGRSFLRLLPEYGTMWYLLEREKR